MTTLDRIADCGKRAAKACLLDARRGEEKAENRLCGGVQFPSDQAENL